MANWRNGAPRNAGEPDDLIVKSVEGGILGRANSPNAEQTG
jgi:hypothetical protein